MRLLDNILKPKGIILILYAILSFFCVAVYVWIVSFTWEFPFSIKYYLTILLIAILTALAFTFWADKKFSFQLKKYFVIPLFQVAIIWIVSNPIRTWQINSSKAKAKLIIGPLETYKERFGTYPENLNDLVEKLNLDIPTRTNIGTRYQYKQNKEYGYSLWFVSYYGYTSHYNKEHGNWVMTD